MSENPEPTRYDPVPAEGPGMPPIMKHFRHSHLPPRLGAVSSWFCTLANQVAINLPDGAEKSVALRKLLEAKDAAVRAANEGAP